MLDSNRAVDDRQRMLSSTNNDDSTDNSGMIEVSAPYDKRSRHNSDNNSNNKISSKLKTASYATRSKLAVGDDEDEISDPDIIAKIADKTPQTKRRIIKEEQTKKQVKLGPWATAFTIFKGFVCTGILYMPGDFVNGGYGFSAITILLCLLLTLYCSKLLIEVYEKVGGSLPEIGFKTYGKVGKILVDVFLFGS